MSLCCVCPTTAAATKTNPPKKNSPAGRREGLRVALCVVSAVPLLLPQKQTHPKKRRSVWTTGRI
jgi:hypothetical protein